MTAEATETMTAEVFKQNFSHRKTPHRAGFFYDTKAVSLFGFFEFDQSDESKKDRPHDRDDCVREQIHGLKQEQEREEDDEDRSKVSKSVCGRIISHVFR